MIEEQILEHGYEQDFEIAQLATNLCHRSVLDTWYVHATPMSPLSLSSVDDFVAAKEEHSDTSPLHLFCPPTFLEFNHQYNHQAAASQLEQQWNTCITRSNSYYDDRATKLKASSSDSSLEAEAYSYYEESKNTEVKEDLLQYPNHNHHLQLAPQHSYINDNNVDTTLQTQQKRYDEVLHHSTNEHITSATTAAVAPAASSTALLLHTLQTHFFYSSQQKQAQQALSLLPLSSSSPSFFSCVPSLSSLEHMNNAPDQHPYSSSSASFNVQNTPIALQQTVPQQQQRITIQYTPSKVSNSKVNISSTSMSSLQQGQGTCTVHCKQQRRGDDWVPLNDMESWYSKPYKFMWQVTIDRHCVSEDQWNTLVQEEQEFNTLSESTMTAKKTKGESMVQIELCRNIDHENMTQQGLVIELLKQQTVTTQSPLQQQQQKMVLTFKVRVEVCSYNQRKSMFYITVSLKGDKKEDACTKLFTSQPKQIKSRQRSTGKNEDDSDETFQQCWTGGFNKFKVKALKKFVVEDWTLKIMQESKAVDEVEEETADDNDRSIEVPSSNNYATSLLQSTQQNKKPRARRRRKSQG